VGFVSILYNQLNENPLKIIITPAVNSSRNERERFVSDEEAEVPRALCGTQADADEV
jgi:hypothetical protein